MGRCNLHLLVTTALIVGAVSIARADFPQKVEALGKVHSFNAEQLNVITGANEGWVFKLNEKSVVTYVAEGGPELMVPKLAVRFRCTLDKRGNIVEPVDKITVFTPKQFFQPVVDVAPPEEAATDEEDKKQKPAAEPAEAPAADSFDAAMADAEEGAATGDDKTAGEVAEGVEYQVVGALVSYRRGKMIVDCGDAGKLKGELAEEAAVTVELEGVPALKAAKAGDAVYAEGYSGTPGQANAKVVKITMAPPAEDEKPTRAPRRRGEADKGDKADKPAVENPGFAE